MFSTSMMKCPVSEQEVFDQRYLGVPSKKVLIIFAIYIYILYTFVSSEEYSIVILCVVARPLDFYWR
jgi:hypothetical protein